MSSNGRENLQGPKIAVNFWGRALSANDIERTKIGLISQFWIIQMEIDDNPKSLKSRCNICAHDTWHKVLHSEERSWSEDDDRWSLYGFDTYLMVSCMGCEAVHLQHIATNSFTVDENENSIPRKTFYPPRFSRHRPNWSVKWETNRHLTFEARRLMNEIYEALQSGSRQLATLGIRALLEHAMVSKVGDKGSIGKNIKAFFEAGYIAEVDKEFFEKTLIEAGHAAMHRLYVPSDAELSTLMDLTEGVMVSVFIHPASARELSAKIPRR